MSNFLNGSLKTINDYFIDSNIIINNDDDFNSKTKKILLKYKRIIGLVLLIILLIIGYYEYYEYYDENFENFENFENYKNYKNNSNQKQQGGAAGIIGVASKLSFTNISRASNLATESKAVLDKAKQIKSANNINKKIGEIKAKGVTGNLKSGLKGTYNIGAAGAQSIRDNADWFYGMIYAVAISLAVCIITIPSIAFFIVGIICFVLLKGKMKYFKGL